MKKNPTDKAKIYAESILGTKLEFLDEGHMQPINIYSKSTDWLGRALTNPCYTKDYDIYPTFLHPITNESLKQPSSYLLLLLQNHFQ